MVYIETDPGLLMSLVGRRSTGTDTGSRVGRKEQEPNQRSRSQKTGALAPARGACPLLATAAPKGATGRGPASVPSH